MSDEKHDAHEERIQRVESTQQGLAVKVAENTAGMQYLAREVTEGYNRVASHIDSVIAPLSISLQESNHRLAAMAERVGEHGRVLDKIEEDKARRAANWGAWKKWVAAAVTGAVAIGLKELVAFLVKHL